MIVAKRTVLRPGLGPEYDIVHREIPDDLRAALTRAGVRHWRIWRDGDELFHVIDVEDRARMGDILAADPANVAWQRIIGRLLDPDQSRVGDGADLPLVWSLQ